MTVLNLNKVDNNLNMMNQAQAVESSEAQTVYIDRSELLLSQMNFIAINNKSFININCK